jgi:hypothetical protein
MSEQHDKCARLRELRIRINDELRELKQSLDIEEHMGLDAPVETRNVIKSLQNVLVTIDQELQKCS